MKIAVSSSADSLDAQMDPRFGRCAYFVVVDTDTWQFEALENAGPQMGSGAGIAAAQMIGDSGAEGVVAGNFGPNAAQALQAGGIRIFQASDLTVREAAQAAASGQLPEVGGATTAAHTGTSGAAAGAQAQGAAPGGMQSGMPGMGMGGGRGMGQGRGMGGGGGMGQGIGGCYPQGQWSPQMGPGMMGPWGPQMGPMGAMGPMGMGPMGPQAQEEMRQYHLSMLMAQADMLQQQLEFIQSQIDYLESLGE
jgi:predicted Fe-Mo cluster-binding NifX family protein